MASSESKSLLVSVDFHGDRLEALRDGERVSVVVRPVCDALGLDADSQMKRLRRATWATPAMMAVVADDGRSREMMTLDLDALPMWLATIEVSRVKPEIRPKLIDYQRECARVLRDHFFGRRTTAEAHLLADVVTLVREQGRQIDALRTTLAALPVASSTNGPVVGKATAKLYVLDALREIAAFKATAIGDKSPTRLRSIRVREETSLRMELGYANASGQSWANLPAARLGDACRILQRMRGDAAALANDACSKRQLAISVVRS